MNKQFVHNIPPGSILTRAKIGFPLIAHYGVYIGNNTVIENNSEHGVRKISLQNFKQGMSGQLIYEPLANPSKAINLANNYLNRPYSLLSFNCEHFVNLIKSGKPSSSQVNFAAFAIAAVVFSKSLK